MTTRLEKAAISVHELLRNNAGSNEEWPITVQCDDDIHDIFIDAINELAEAVEESGEYHESVAP